MCSLESHLCSPLMFVLLLFHPFLLFLVAGEICAFKIHGQEAPFEAVVLNRTSGEGVLRARNPIDCELQKEYTFIIQAYDCGAGASGIGWKKSHKWVGQTLRHALLLKSLYSSHASWSITLHLSLFFVCLFYTLCFCLIFSLTHTVCSWFLICHLSISPSVLYC